MNNEENNTTPKTPEAWVPQKEYQDVKNQQVADAELARRLNGKIRAFYILLAIGGIMVAIAFIGGLAWPHDLREARGGTCSSSGFDVVQFYLNLAGYPILLAAGIVGATVQKVAVRTIGIIVIVLAAILGPISFLFAVGKALCGV